jgi:hypothetical protein
MKGMGRIFTEEFTAKGAKYAEKNTKMQPELFFMENVLTLVG